MPGTSLQVKSCKGTRRMLSACGCSFRIKDFGPVQLRWAHFGQFQYDMDGPVETVAKLGPFTLLHSNRCARAVLKWKVDVFYRCRTPIPFSHFGMEEKWSFVCENEMGPAQPNRALEFKTRRIFASMVGLGRVWLPLGTPVLSLIMEHHANTF